MFRGKLIPALLMILVFFNVAAIFGAVYIFKDKIPWFKPKQLSEYSSFMEVEKFLDQLRRREIKIAKRELELDASQEELKEFSEALQRQRQELKLLRNEITNNVLQVKKIEKVNIERLARIYSEIPIHDVVNIITNSKDELIAQILVHMTEKQAAEILTEYSGIHPDKAAKLTELIKSCE